MKKILNSHGFSALEVALVIIVMGIIGGTGAYVYNSQKDTKELLETSSTADPVITKQNKTETKTEETLDWQRVDSGKKQFSAQFPDGWGEVVRPLDSDWLTIRGQKQPIFTDGKAVVVKDMEAFGTDGYGVLSIMISDNVVGPEGVAADFEIGNLKGKKYTYIVPKDTERGLGERDKGDKKYDYRFDLGNSRQLVVSYQVYVNTDDNDQVATVDKIVKSIKLK